MKAKKLYVVLGMHRSGTSAITRGLQALGIELGDRLMPEASENNEKGFWEDVDINRLNIELLHFLNDDWDCLAPFPQIELQRPDINKFRLRAIGLLRERFELTDVYGVKDPRISRLLPFWQSVFVHMEIEVGYIIACRNPMSVVRSLQKRDGFPFEKGYQLWLGYTLASLIGTEGETRVLVDYDQLMESPFPQLNRIAKTFKLDLDENSNACSEYRNEFLEANLRHSRFAADDLKLETAASPAVVELFSLVSRLARDEETPDAQSVIQQVRRLTEEREGNVPLLRYADGIKALEIKLSNVCDELAIACQSERDAIEKNTVLTAQVAGLSARISTLESETVELSWKVSQSEAGTAILHDSLLKTHSESASIQATLDRIESESAALRAALMETRASTSWRLTAPLRLAGTYTKRLRKGMTALCFQLKRESPLSIFKKTIRVFRREGLHGLKSRIYHQYLTAQSNLGLSHPQYQDVQPTSILRTRNGVYELSPFPGGYTYIEPKCPADLASVLNKLELRPIFSIVVPLYNTPVELLNAVLISVQKQWYPHWEVILADDASQDEATLRALGAIEDSQVRVVRLDENSGIAAATNVAIDAAKGDYIVFMDHDDEITVDCLYEMALCINRDNPDFIYSDEDKLTEDGEYAQPHFKPEWSPDTLMSTMYTCHATCVKRNIISEIGGLRSEFDGCQDWDFVLRLSEYSDRISHIPKVLYHWRIIPQSVASELAAKPYVIETSRRVREDALKRRGLNGTLEAVDQVPGHFRVNYHVRGEPLVTIIIPTRDNRAVLERCVQSILEKSTYRKFQLIVIDNGSVHSETLQYLENLQKSGAAEVIRHDAEFNFSELNNIGAKASLGELLLFLNDDTEVLGSDWLERMIGYAQLDHVAAVGAKLVYPGGSMVQHAGVLNLQDGPGHAFLRGDRNQPGYFMRNLLEYNWLAVTGACLMMESRKFEAIGGFDEMLPIAYNDIDLCMRAVKAGYFNVVCQTVTLVHHESVSRGIDHIDPVKQARLKRELRRLYDNHPEFYQYDPFYNVNLHPNGINFEVPV